MTVTKLKESHHFAPKSNARRSVNTLHNDPAFLQRFWNHPAPSFPQSVPYFDREKLFVSFFTFVSSTLFANCVQ